MSESKYSIVSKEFTGIRITGYTIKNEDGKLKNLDTADIIKLARSDRLAGAEAVLDTDSGEYVLIINDGIDSLPDSDRSKGIKLDLTARLIKNNKCIGYKAVDSKGKTYKLSIDKVWSLAEQGSINNVQGKYYNNHKVIISINNFKLVDLPKLIS